MQRRIPVQVSARHSTSCTHVESWIRLDSKYLNQPVDHFYHARTSEPNRGDYAKMELAEDWLLDNHDVDCTCHFRLLAESESPARARWRPGADVGLRWEANFRLIVNDVSRTAGLPWHQLSADDKRGRARQGSALGQSRRKSGHHGGRLPDRHRRIEDQRIQPRPITSSWKGGWTSRDCHVRAWWTVISGSSCAWTTIASPTWMGLRFQVRHWQC